MKYFWIILLIYLCSSISYWAGKKLGFQDARKIVLEILELQEKDEK